jgi:hypothetical protein
VSGLPPSLGADQDTVALPFPAVAVTPVGAAGFDRAAEILMNDATDGTPLELRMNSM